MDMRPAADGPVPAKAGRQDRGSDFFGERIGNGPTIAKSLRRSAKRAIDARGRVAIAERTDPRYLDGPAVVESSSDRPASHADGPELVVDIEADAEEPRNRRLAMPMMLDDESSSGVAPDRPELAIWRHGAGVDRRSLRPRRRP